MALRLSTVVSDVGPSYSGKPRFRFRIRSVAATVRNMAFSATFKVLIDSHLHVILKKYPTKFVGCCLTNPADDGSGLKQFEDLVLKMTNKVGKEIFQRAGELNVPVGFMCMKVHLKFSALFRVSRAQFPYLDLSPLLSQVVSHFGANRVMWGSDFPFVVAECGYKGAKEAMHLIAKEISLPLADLE
ncbi:hypothetical protein JHK85_003817 [Glycine max]|nr:hypothetical protein JHK85_003817 [Glycine max]